mmetsp:Transcript_12445/g.25349  ORF Transcript_12445/g.25349 Transcript_12445/m.25349 type:complete len:739 (-) Transcript_12445:337-2553(-)
MIPLVDQTYRSSLYPHTNPPSMGVPCLPTTTTPGEVELRLESGDPDVAAGRVDAAVYIGAGSDPFLVVDDAFSFLERYLNTFKTKRHKPVPGSADVFGWCTWDAFYSKVNPKGVQKGLSIFADNDTPAKMLILDDGWQRTRNDKEYDKGEDLRENVDAGELDGGGVISPDEFKDDQSIFERAVSWFYDNKVAVSDIESVWVRAWRYLSNTVLKSKIIEYFADATDWAKRLTAFEANSKFNPLKGFVASLKSEHNLDYVYCWHALLGYWLGSDPTSASMDAFDVRINKPCIKPCTKGDYDSWVLQVEPSMAWSPSTFVGVGVPSRERAFDFYNNLHKYLNRSGVDGVKVDAQSCLSTLGTGMGGGASLTRVMVQAMERSVSSSLRTGAVIGCMAHTSENLFSFQTTPIARASDDFYPRDARSHGQHVMSCAFNTLMLGNLVTPDWDCFQSSHEFGMFHATARAVGGCPVYVSDRVNQSDFNVLKKLVLPDGTVFRARLPGRPTRDSLFNDAQGDGVSAMKVWNMNDVNGIVATFNVQGYQWNQPKHDLDMHPNYRSVSDFAPVTARVKPSDVEGLESPVGRFAVFSHATQDLHLASRDEEIPVKLQPNASDALIVAPVLALGDQVLFAPLGCTSMLNGGGAIRYIDTNPEQGDVDVGVVGVGRLSVYASAKPVGVLARKEGEDVQMQTSLEFQWKEHDPALGLGGGLVSIELPKYQPSNKGDKIPVHVLSFTWDHLSPT